MKIDNKVMKVDDGHLIVPIVVSASKNHLHAKSLERLVEKTFTIAVVPFFFSIVCEFFLYFSFYP